MRPILDRRRLFLLGVPAVGAAVVATALVAFILTSGGDDGRSADLPKTPPPQVEDGTVEVPANWTRPPEVTPAPPTHIQIRGQQVPLAPGMTYGRVGGTGNGIPEPGVTLEPTPAYREVWEVSYDSKPAEAGYSWLSFDENFNLLTNAVRPEDQHAFQAIIDALNTAP